MVALHHVPDFRGAAPQRVLSVISMLLLELEEAARLLQRTCELLLFDSRID